MPSPLLVTMVSYLPPDGLVITARTFPLPVGVTERASTVKSVVESRNTPDHIRQCISDTTGGKSQKYSSEQHTEGQKNSDDITEQHKGVNASNS